MAHYSAALICFLSACIHVLPFQTLDEFVNDGTYKLIVIRDSADYDIVTVSSLSDQSLTFTFIVAHTPFERSKLYQIVAFGNMELWYLTSNVIYIIIIYALQDIFATVSGAARGKSFLYKTDEINEGRIGIAENPNRRFHASTINNLYFYARRVKYESILTRESYFLKVTRYSYCYLKK